jgi:hypothetical protein
LFVLSKEKNWTEIVEGSTNFFSEVGQTNDYVELQNRFANIRVRLYRDACQVQLSGSPFREYYRGKWEQSPKSNYQPEDGESQGFLPLFNGKDRTGWKTSSEWDKDWRVENGILRWKSLNVSRLWTESDIYGDFHLRSEIRISARQYANLIFRDACASAGGSHRGYVIVLNSTNGHPNKTGTLVLTRGEGDGGVVVRQTLVQPDQWFTLDVIAEGSHLVVKVDGMTVADYSDPSKRFSRGRVSLLAMNSERDEQRYLEFRKIEIKKLRAK